MLITPLERRCFAEGDQLGLGEHSDYVAAMKQAAESLQVPLVDLYSMSRHELRRAGAEKTKTGICTYLPGSILPIWMD